MPAPSAPQTICLAGKNSIAVHALNHLRTTYPQHRLLCLPNRTDTGVHGWQPSLKATAQAFGVPLVTLPDLYPISNLLFLSLECDTLIKPHLFASHRLYNIHFSLLPAYRGMYTAALPILHGQTGTGVTLHRIDAGIDTGDIIDQLAFPIGPDDTSRDLYHHYLKHAETLFDRNIDALLADTCRAMPQPEEGASYFARASIDYARLALDVHQPATAVRNQVRAYTFREYQVPTFHGWPISLCTIQPHRSGATPGTIIHDTEDGFTVTTATTDILLRKDYLPQLWQAARTNQVLPARQALRHVTAVNERGPQGWSVLAIAAYHGAAQVVELLLQQGADPHTANERGTTALMYACSHYEATGYDAVVRLLLAYGADRHARDAAGLTVSDHMKARNCYDLLPLLT